MPTAESGPTERRFVVQLHHATRPHYDLRFEMDGTLASWAVPKGPTLDPSVRRSAFHVDDHPLEYFDFEGVIPAGQYGAGDVIVWDVGTWQPHGTDDPAAAVAAGELHAEVHGEKLRGRLALVRRGGGSDDNVWLLVHKRDAHAVAGWKSGDYPKSVLSGRTSDEVRNDPARVWRSDLPAAEASIDVRNPDLAGPGDDALAALDELGEEGTWQVFGRELRVTNLEKVLFPARDGEPPVTKWELVRYAAQIARVLLPYLRGRALNLHRYPNGAGRKGFWHKQLPDHAPDWVTGWDNPEADPGETTTYLVADEPATVVWVANFGGLEWPAWTSCTDEPHRPSYALVDIDPGEKTSWEEVLALARLHRTAVEHLGIRAQPKVTGRRGIQIWVPVTRGPSFDKTRAWVERLSRTVGAVMPELVSWKWQVADGAGWPGSTTPRTRSTRPWSRRTVPVRPGAPVSVPIEWDEPDDPELRPDGFTVRTVLDRLAEHGDPFRSLLAVDQSLPRLA